jgi:hypothetical protein
MLSGPKAADPILTTTLFGAQRAGPTTRFVTGWPCNGNGIDRLACQPMATGNPQSGAPSSPRQGPAGESAAEVVANDSERCEDGCAGKQ